MTTTAGRRLLSLIAAAATATAQTPAAALPQIPTDEPPTLVVLIAVDQLRPDSFDRFREEMTGGFARLLAEGAYFTESELDHATTETAPGHASMLSGRFPRGHGVLRNSAGVQDPHAPVLGEPTATGASPFRFRGSTLFDWMRLIDPRTRALAVSRKDRGAIIAVHDRPRAAVQGYVLSLRAEQITDPSTTSRSTRSPAPALARATR